MGEARGIIIPFFPATSLLQTQPSWLLPKARAKRDAFTPAPSRSLLSHFYTDGLLQSTEEGLFLTLPQKHAGLPTLQAALCCAHPGPTLGGC